SRDLGARNRAEHLGLGPAAIPCRRTCRCCCSVLRLLELLLLLLRARLLPPLDAQIHFFRLSVDRVSVADPVVPLLLQIGAHGQVVDGVIDLLAHVAECRNDLCCTACAVSANVVPNVSAKTHFTPPVGNHNSAMSSPSTGSMPSYGHA